MANRQNIKIKRPIQEVIIITKREHGEIIEDNTSENKDTEF